MEYIFADKKNTRRCDLSHLSSRTERSREDLQKDYSTTRCNWEVPYLSAPICRNYSRRHESVLLRVMHQPRVHPLTVEESGMQRIGSVHEREL